MTTIVRLALGAALLFAGTGVAAAGPAILLSDTVLLDGPGADYAHGAQLPAGTHVDLLDCAGSAKVWCLVDRRGKRGWVSLDLLDLYPGKKGVNLPGDVAESSGNNGGPGTPQLQAGVLAELAADNPRLRDGGGDKASRLESLNLESKLALKP